jgi:CheY-like chemotaxis protein
VPIIALTADPQYQQSRLCKNIGMNESLAKPIRLTSLLQAFDDVMAAVDADMNVAA